MSGLEPGQEMLMAHFKALLTVKDEEGIDKDRTLEQVKAYALDEIFTDNTNLSLNVQEDEILGDVLLRVSYKLTLVMYIVINKNK